MTTNFSHGLKMTPTSGLNKDLNFRPIAHTLLCLQPQLLKVVDVTKDTLTHGQQDLGSKITVPSTELHQLHTVSMGFTLCVLSYLASTFSPFDMCALDAIAHAEVCRSLLLYPLSHQAGILPFDM